MVTVAGHSLPDAAPDNWVDRLAPAFAQPYLRLARLDRPIGTWLLLWPCLWSVMLAEAAGGGTRLPDPILLLLFAVGAVSMRGAGCTFNDIADREFDAQVVRTALRPIPSGAVSVRNASVFLLLELLVGAIVLVSFNSFAIVVGVVSLALVFAYPFVKRVTYWPQLFLGFTFSWGALLGWSAVAGRLALAPVLLYVAGVFWTLGYDTIYSHQDRKFDALIGLKSAALKLGASTRSWLMVFYGAALAFLGAAGAVVGLSWFFYAGLGLAAIHLASQILRLDIDDSARCLELFKSNASFGAIVFVSILAGSLGMPG